MPSKKRTTAKSAAAKSAKAKSAKAKSVKAFKKPTAADMFLDYIATGRLDLVEEYLDNNKRIKIENIRNCKGETVLHVAAATHQNRMLEQLLPFFNEDTLDARDMYGLPAYITAIKYGNPAGAELISRYHKSIRTKPYKFRNYSFRSMNDIGNLNNNSIDYINQNETLVANPVINPMNIWSYIPSRPNKNRSPHVNIYNNKNTRRIVIENKSKSKKRQRKKAKQYHISKVNSSKSHNTYIHN
jgi:hypothetical protein